MLLKASAGDSLEALYALAVGSGLRLGELLGLTWRDVDLEARAIQVRRQLSEDVHTGKLELAEPKTSRSRRRVELPSFSTEALRRHRQALTATPHPERLVFTDSDGGPLRRSNLQRRSFEPLLARAGLRKIRFHDLRHSAATLLLAQGVHPKVVQERLGHSTITLTLDTYSHVLEGMQREAATKLDAILG
jgi:integrase